MACTPGEKENTGPGLPQHCVGISLVALGKSILHPGVHLEENIFPFQGQKTLLGAAKGLLLAGDRGKHRW